MLPKVLLFKDQVQARTMISFRWLGTGFDVAKSKGVLFIQFGKKPVKFIYVSKSKPPVTMLSYGWRTIIRTPFFRMGTTLRPLDLVKPWRKQCTHKKKASAHKKHGTMTVDLISSSSG